MCGIFGIISSKNSSYSSRYLSNALKQLALLSESRGKDSSGLCLFNQEGRSIDVVKGPLPIHTLLKDQKAKSSISLSFNSGQNARFVFGHARLVTNGTQLNDANNQPVVKDGVVGIHNGIIVNVDELWEQHPNIKREYKIDTEVLLALVRMELNNGLSIESAVSKSINKVFGTVATALAFDDVRRFVLATNNGSLYTIHNNKDILFFASERYMLSQFAKKVDLSQIGDYGIKQIFPNTGVVINLENFEINEFDFKENHSIDNNKTILLEKFPINIFTVKSHKKQLSAVVDLNYIHLNPKAEKEKALLQYPIEKIKQLKRCTKCLLPETFPFIDFDEKGECNYCKNYVKKNQPKPIRELQQLLEPYRKTGGRPEVLVPYSGGRDSTYALHIVKEVLGLKPLTYTYDWGMVTDLARRNVSRVCGKLGVENIIVAANMQTKRANIKRNINAWLKKPELGMIPLFMSGDKYFFYYSNLISKQNDLDISIWGSNQLENTDFKTGFCGISPNFSKERIDHIDSLAKIRLFSFFARNFMQNPSYLNKSIIDTMGSFMSRYLIRRHGYFQLFDYLEWDEDVINNTIINLYDWEKSVDTSSTWRIGDGTASFYNYIYTRIVGFSENDTFRSNQIREGMITREEGLKRIYEENKPRYNSLKWYLEIVGLDFEATIKKVNLIKQQF